MPRHIVYKEDAINQTLKDWGFIHYTGLPYKRLPGNTTERVQALEEHLGMWNGASVLEPGNYVIITEQGEVWIGGSPRRTVAAKEHGKDTERETVIELHTEQFLKELCPKGAGSFDYLQDRAFEATAINARAAVPYYDFGEKHSPIPKPIKKGERK